MKLDWIENAINDLLKQICCGSVEKAIIGGASCRSNKQIHNESVERTITGEVSYSNNNVQLVLNYSE